MSTYGLCVTSTVASAAAGDPNTYTCPGPGFLNDQGLCVSPGCVTTFFCFGVKPELQLALFERALTSPCMPRFLSCQQMWCCRAGQERRR